MRKVLFLFAIVLVLTSCIKYTPETITVKIKGVESPVQVEARVEDAYEVGETVYVSRQYVYGTEPDSTWYTLRRDSSEKRDTSYIVHWTKVDMQHEIKEALVLSVPKRVINNQ